MQGQQVTVSNVLLVWKVGKGPVSGIKQTAVIVVRVINPLVGLSLSGFV